MFHLANSFTAILSACLLSSCHCRPRTVPALLVSTVFAKRSVSIPPPSFPSVRFSIRFPLVLYDRYQPPRSISKYTRVYSPHSKMVACFQIQEVISKMRSRLGLTNSKNRRMEIVYSFFGISYLYQMLTLDRALHSTSKKDQHPTSLDTAKMSKYPSIQLFKSRYLTEVL